MDSARCFSLCLWLARFGPIGQQRGRAVQLANWTELNCNQVNWESEREEELTRVDAGAGLRAERAPWLMVLAGAPLSFPNAFGRPVRALAGVLLAPPWQLPNRQCHRRHFHWQWCRQLHSEPVRWGKQDNLAAHQRRAQYDTDWPGGELA